MKRKIPSTHEAPKMFYLSTLAIVWTLVRFSSHPITTTYIGNAVVLAPKIEIPSWSKISGVELELNIMKFET